MGKVFTNSIIQPVYYKIGKDSVTGQMQYRRAPFDVIKINGVTCVQPRSDGIHPHSLAQLGRDRAEEQNNYRDGDMGYETLEPIILNENQVGNGSDNWVGLHKISNL